MVMIARVNIRQFVLIVFNLCYFRQFHAVDAIPKTATGATNRLKSEIKWLTS